MTIKAATVEGKEGWYDDTSQEFLPADQWKPGEYEGKSGLFNTSTNEFQPIDVKTQTPTKSPDQSTGEYLRSLLRRFTPYARPALEYGGGALGSAVTGGPVTPTGLLGGGLGYSIGRKGADVLEQLAGQKTPKDFLTETAETMKDVAGGTMMDTAGANTAELLRNAGRMISETNLAKWLYSKAIRTPLTDAWKRVIPSKDFTRRTEVVTEGLKNEVLPNDQGLAKIVHTIEDLDSRVKAKVAELTKMGGHDVPVEDLTKSLDPLKFQAEMSRGAAKNLDDIYAIEQEVMRKGGADDISSVVRRETPGTLTPSEVHALKQEFYKDVNYDRSKPLFNESGRFTEEATKRIAHVAMTTLEEMAPDIIGPLNKKSAIYLDLKQAVEHTIARYNASGDLTTMGTKILAIKNLGLAALEVVTGTPTIKAKLAFAAKNAGNITAKGIGRGVYLPLMRTDESGHSVLGDIFGDVTGSDLRSLRGTSTLDGKDVGVRREDIEAELKRRGVR